MSSNGIDLADAAIDCVDVVPDVVTVTHRALLYVHRLLIEMLLQLADVLPLWRADIYCCTRSSSSPRSSPQQAAEDILILGLATPCRSGLLCRSDGYERCHERNTVALLADGIYIGGGVLLVILVILVVLLLMRRSCA